MKIKGSEKGGAVVSDEAQAKMGWRSRAAQHRVVMPETWRNFFRARRGRSCLGARSDRVDFLVGTGECFGFFG